MDIFFQTAPSTTEAAFWQSPFAIALITLAASLVSIILANLLQRKAEHRAWLRENRITAFAEFLKVYGQSETAALEYVEKAPNIKIDEEGWINDILTIFHPVSTHLKIVRLLLNKEYRDKFEYEVLKLIELFSNARLETKGKRWERIGKINIEIQKIFETHLTYSNAISRLKFLSKRV